MAMGWEPWLMATTLEDPTVSWHAGYWSLRETILKATVGFSIYP